MKTVLVTGAAGYIGCVLVPKLLTQGYQVKAVDRFFFGQDKLQPHPNLLLIKEDSRHLNERHFIGVDFVIDLVAISNDPSGEQFAQATLEINHLSRARTTTLAKKHQATRYILPSSCSIYGCQQQTVNEQSTTNPLTTYAKANELAEQASLALASSEFCVTIMRQATVFGFSPRMRFDLAINGMTYGAFQNGVLPLMRDGKQFRPMIHVEDTTDVMCLLLNVDSSLINRQIFNVGDNKLCYQIGELGQKVAATVGELTNRNIPIDWYGEPDHRSYLVSFDKINQTLGWHAKWDAVQGVSQIVNKLKSGELTKTTDTITLEWYQELVKWHKIIKDIELHGGIIDIEP